MSKLNESIKRFFVSSIWEVAHLRRIQSGSLFKWQEVIPVSISKNIVTDQGVNAALNILFHAATQITTWYVAIFETNTACVAGMTYATPVFTESTAYAEATRPAYVEAESTVKSLTNSASKATFTINATKSIYGGALVGGGSDATTKADVAGGGILFSASLFSTQKDVIADDIITVTVILTGADA